MLKFTQEIKDKWLEALKSGKYKQGFHTLYDPYEDTYCCIGVLGDIHPKLKATPRGNKPYNYLKDNDIDTRPLWSTNDDQEYIDECEQGKQARDYSNVIPLIEQLPVKD